MRKLVIMAVTVLGMWATQTSALTITTGTDLNGNTTITGDSDVLGIVFPGTGGSDTQVSWISELIGMGLGTSKTDGGETYIRSGNDLGPLPTDGLAFAGKWEANDPGFRFNDIHLHGAAYVLAKYDADQGGSVIWYLGNLENTWTLDLPGKFNGRAISHFSVFTTTGSTFEPGGTLPDGGSTLLLLGAGVLGMAAVRKSNLLRVQQRLAVK